MLTSIKKDHFFLAQTWSFVTVVDSLEHFVMGTIQGQGVCGHPHLGGGGVHDAEGLVVHIRGSSKSLYSDLFLFLFLFLL